MIRFMAGPPAALLNAIEMERAMMTGMGAVVVLSGAPKIEYAPQQQFAVQSPVHGGFAQPGMQVAPMGMPPQLYYGGGARAATSRRPSSRWATPSRARSLRSSFSSRSRSRSSSLSSSCS